MQIRNTYAEEFIHVIGKNPQEANPLNQGVIGPNRLLQDAVVEGQPTQLSIDQSIRMNRIFSHAQIYFVKVSLRDERLNFASLIQTNQTMLVGKNAPHFSSNAYVNGKIVRNFSLEAYKGKQNVLLIFYPKNFTSLCQSELVAFQDQLIEFEARNTAVVACSTDTADSHAAAARIPREDGGIMGVQFPIVSDANKTIATNYDVISGEYDYSEDGLLTSNSEMTALRGSFLIDKNGMVQHHLLNFFPLGRSVDEALRMADALCHVQESGQGCPANWTKE